MARTFYLKKYYNVKCVPFYPSFIITVTFVITLQFLALRVSAFLSESSSCYIYYRGFVGSHTQDHPSFRSGDQWLFCCYCLFNEGRVQNFSVVYLDGKLLPKRNGWSGLWGLKRASSASLSSNFKTIYARHPYHVALSLSLITKSC